jgi:hypothetical protein
MATNGAWCPTCRRQFVKSTTLYSNSPILLDCTHITCYSCVCITTSTAPAWLAATGVRCPVCQKHTWVLRTEVDQLKHHEPIHLLHAVDPYTALVCAKCKQPAATLSMTNCTHNVCRTCIIQTTRIVRTTESVACPVCHCTSWPTTRPNDAELGVPVYDRLPRTCPNTPSSLRSLVSLITKL